MCDYNFTWSYANYSLFTYRKVDVFMSLLVFVDDITLAANNTNARKQFKAYLNE